jgi:CheY-like chemotaxis protein
MCLEKEGRFKVDVAHSAEEALERIRSGMYSCIISDYEMPLMNGIDLLKAVRNIDHDIPFILFSGRGRETVIIDAINTGADFYIQKGGEPKALFAELNHKVEYAIEQRNTRIALKRRDSILEAVSLVANLFLGKEDFDKVLQEAITLFGLATEVDTVRLFKFESNDDPLFPCIIKNIASWTRVAIHCDMREAFLKNETIPIKQELMTRLVSGETVILKQEEIRAYDPVKNDECAKSIAVFPVFVDQKAGGSGGLQIILVCEQGLVWNRCPPCSITIIGSALVHQCDGRTLQPIEDISMYSLRRRLCDPVPDILWAKYLEENSLVNQAGCTLLGETNTDEPIGKNEDTNSKCCLIITMIFFCPQSPNSKEGSGSIGTPECGNWMSLRSIYHTQEL